MDTSNHWYGHAHILARYCGLDDKDPPTIWGVLQHGWNVMHGLGPGHAPPYGFPKFVWSDIAVRRGQALGWRDYSVIGAPWGYLLTEFGPPPPTNERDGTIFYPFHRWDNSTVEGDHEVLARQVLATEPGPLTVCLYFLEFDVPEIRDAYEDAGCRVICHGRRGLYRKGTDPEFLYRQHTELIAHRRVVSNRLTTAILYGASVGCEAGVYGDPMIYVETQAGLGRVRDWDEYVRRQYPELHGVQTDAQATREIATRELGLDRLACPEELRQLFGWTSPT
jgi:hypothetical protein